MLSFLSCDSLSFVSCFFISIYGLPCRLLVFFWNIMEMVQCHARWFKKKKQVIARGMAAACCLDGYVLPCIVILYEQICGCTTHTIQALPYPLSFLSLLFPWLEDPCLRPLPSLLSLASSDSHLSVSYLSTLNRSCGSQNSETKPVRCATKSWTSRRRNQRDERHPLSQSEHPKGNRTLYIHKKKGNKRSSGQLSACLVPIPNS